MVCDRCKYKGEFFVCDGCVYDPDLKERFEPLTNGDLIRARNDHELADTISSFICDINEGVEYSDNPNRWLEWLKQPAEVDHDL